ncbi:MAG: S8 family serine peptidase [Legionella sp.]|nr:S8 family serine peptidase [Legionella sp.]
MQSIYKVIVSIFLLTMSLQISARAIVDADVIKAVQSSNIIGLKPPTRALIFFKSITEKKSFIESFHTIADVTIQDLGLIPALAIHFPSDLALLNQIANSESVAQITSYKNAASELDISSQILKLTPSYAYPDVSNWWAQGYTGKNAVVGIIDTGIDTLHPALSQKKFIIRKEEGSHYNDYINGVKEPHGTGVACIYSSTDEKYKGIAYGASTIVSGMAGEETADTSSLMLTMSSLDWMLNRAGVKPNIINYSMGNGKLACPDCPEWSGLAKVIDYVVNTQKILWVKSAGNMGYIDPTDKAPFASTLTVPGDNYNAITVANMDANVTAQGQTIRLPEREKHSIKSTSSRGPTPFGRRKPDITAPGHDTRTCAPDPLYYKFSYTEKMDYKNGYRLMGGTSSAAPHVGASALLLQDAGITDPMAIKALLINSADTWTDDASADKGHCVIEGSAWNRTYGWGYINMDAAFKQRNHIISAALTEDNPVWEYPTRIHKGDKVTLVHERRVGYAKAGAEWKLSPLSLEIIDSQTHQVLDSDSSRIDTVHQVSYCKREPGQKTCSVSDETRDIVIRVTLATNTIDGNVSEPFVIVTQAPL